MLRHNTSLNSLKYKTADLLVRIEENLLAHEQDFHEAMILYRSALGEALRKKLDLLERGVDVDPTLSLPKPVQFKKEYERAIVMLSMTTAEEIELDSMTFSQLVLDEWDWKTSFELNTKSYSANAR